MAGVSTDRSRTRDANARITLGKAAKLVPGRPSVAQTNTQWRKQIEAILVESIAGGEFVRRSGPFVMASLLWSTIDGIIVESMFDTEAEGGQRSLSALKQGLIAELTSWSTTGPAD